MDTPDTHLKTKHEKELCRPWEPCSSPAARTSHKSPFKQVRSCVLFMVALIAIYAGSCGTVMAQSSLGSKSPTRACVDKTTKWGYVDSTGKLVIVPRFDATNSFSENLAAVQVDGKWGYIDTT